MCNHTWKEPTSNPTSKKRAIVSANSANSRQTSYAQIISAVPDVIGTKGILRSRSFCTVSTITIARLFAVGFKVG